MENFGACYVARKMGDIYLYSSMGRTHLRYGVAL